MPSIEVHKAISKHRTKEDFEELHEWMDEATEYLGFNHRLERHFYTEEYKDFIKKKWGSKAVVEWLFHIALDNLETAAKFADKAYLSAYDEVEVSFKDGKITGCKFHNNSLDGISGGYWTKYNKSP